VENLMKLGRLGIFSIGLLPETVPGNTGFAPVDSGLRREAAAEIEDLGFSAIWVPGGPTGATVLDAAAELLDATRAITVGTDIHTIWTRSPQEMAAICARMDAANPGRFMLGLGASHANLVEARGQIYEKPLAMMRGYLEGLDAEEVPVRKDRRMIAALGPKMLELTRDMAAGAVPYMVSTEHTAMARKILGPGPLLAPEQAVVLDTDRARAREVARRHVSAYFHYANYMANFRRLGFTDEDFADGGSDRLIDAIVVTGDLEAIERRVNEHFEAGASHVALQVLVDRGDSIKDATEIPREQWRILADLIGS
jgi:probable F420-dependent oxidoreductase